MLPYCCHSIVDCSLPEHELLKPVWHFGTGLIHLLLAEYLTVVVVVANKNTLIYVNYIESILKTVKYFSRLGFKSIKMLNN